MTSENPLWISPKAISAITLLFLSCGDQQADEVPPLGESRPRTVSRTLNSVGAVGDQQRPVVASLGSQSLVVWVDSRNGNKDIYAARVDAAGKVLDQGGFAVTTAAGEQSRPRVAHDGKGFIVAWEDGRGGDYDIYAARVDTTGKVLDTTGIRVTKDPANQFAPALAHGAKGFLLLWADLRNGTAFDIYGTMLDSAGKLLWSVPSAVSAGKHDEGEPALAAGGGGFLAVWSDTRNSDKDIYRSAPCV